MFDNLIDNATMLTKVPPVSSSAKSFVCTGMTWGAMEKKMATKES